MTQSKLMLVGVIAVLMLGAPGTKSASAGQLQNDTVIAGEDAAPETAAPGDAYGTGSAKMGEGEGTQSGDQRATHEDDTQKIDQPDRRNPTTSNDTYQGEEPAPSDYDHGTDK
jgi:hypothetical protein